MERTLIKKAYGKYYSSCKPGKNGWSSSVYYRRFFAYNIEVHPTVKIYWRPMDLSKIKETKHEIKRHRVSLWKILFGLRPWKKRLEF